MLTPPVDHVVVSSVDGARAVIALDGAHVVSWIPAGSESDRLFVSARSGFGEGVSIRGGIPLIFPQFGADGPLQRHGFARNRRWVLVAQQSGGAEAVARFALIDDEVTRAIWPHPFHAQVTVRVKGPRLSVSLEIANSASEPATFTAALHPYFAVANAYATHVVGLEGRQYRDALRERSVHVEESASLAISGEIDRVYFDVANAIEIREPDRALRIEKVGFPDAVVWNPGPDGTRGRADFEPGDELRMLCVEAAAVQHPITLAPGARWEGTQIMTDIGGS